MGSLKQAFLTNWKTTFFGLAAAILTWLTTADIGNQAIEKNLLALALLLMGGTAADAVKQP